MMDSSASSKKRKRDDESQTGSVTLQTVSSEGSELGPALVTYPAIIPPPDTGFRAFRLRAGNAPGSRETIKGETNAVDFESISEDKSSLSPSCQYMVGVYDKSSKAIHLHKAPHYVMAHTVKRIKNLNYATIDPPKYMSKMHDLGETFGSKKTIKTVRAAMRNRVDASAMEDTTHLQRTIETRTATLPSQEDSQSAAERHRPIPPFKANASTPSEVYNIDDIALPAELNSFDVEPILSAKTPEERVHLMPYWNSTWVRNYMERVFSSAVPNQDRLRELMFTCSMLAFRRIVGAQSSKRPKKVKGTLSREHRLPETVIDGLISRFTVIIPGEEKLTLTAEMETKLLAYTLVLCLRLNDYSVPIEEFAVDLSIEPKRLCGLLTNLGCRIISKVPKRGELKIPLHFPVVKLRKRVR